MQNKSKNTLLSEQQRVLQRKRQIRNWIILVSVILAVALTWVVISLVGGKSRPITAKLLPGYADQQVTAFLNGALFYDGADINYVNANGTLEWSYPAGDGASYYASETHIIVWADRQLAIVDSKGRSSYNRSMEQSIQFARVGKKHAAIVTGDDEAATIHIRDLNGAQVDNETNQFDGCLVLDCGFYGKNDEYLWTISYDLYAPEVTTRLQTFQVGHLSTGSAVFTTNLPSKIIYVGDRLHVFTTQQLYTYDYKGVEDVSGKTLVYGWRYLDHDVPKRGNANILLAPSAQTENSDSINELRIISGSSDRRYTLPTACVGASVSGESIYAFSQTSLYSGQVSSQQFYTHHIPLPDGRHVTGFIGLTDNGYAIILSDNEVYSVSLPK